MNRFVIVAFTNQRYEDGFSFHASDWPLHITIIPTFEIDSDKNAVLELVEKSIEGIESFECTVGSEVMFGSRHSLPVSVISPSKNLDELHAKLLKPLRKNKARFSNASYVGVGYKPHITHQKSGKPSKGQKIMINNLSVVDTRPVLTEYNRQVIKSCSF